MITRTLTWQDLRQLGKTDNARRWYPADGVAEYFRSIRSPSRAWPSSYAKAAQTKKFAIWLADTRPEIAQQMGVSA